MVDVGDFSGADRRRVEGRGGSGRSEQRGTECAQCDGRHGGFRHEDLYYWNPQAIGGLRSIDGPGSSASKFSGHCRDPILLKECGSPQIAIFLSDQMKLASL
jgi:hypothetical protein